MIEVTCAIIQQQGKILATKRSHGMHLAGQWEFPGGKIEEGETGEACIVREILEELNINVRVKRKFIPISHQYPDKEILLIPFLCEIMSGEIRLREHDEFRWVGKEDILQLNWAAADMELILVNQPGIDKLL